MGQFAKIFDTPHGQLLLTKDGQDDEHGENWLLTARGEDRNGVCPSMTFYFDTRAQMDAAFADASLEKAINVAQSLQGVVDRMTTEQAE